MGAMVVPNELSPWARLSRDEAFSGLPRIAAYGFAAICRSVTPVASRNSDPRKKAYDFEAAAGENSPQPAAQMTSAVTMVRW